MKLAHPLHLPHALHFELSERSRQILFAIVCTLLPYVVAAIGVFAFHEQSGL